jgi:hypothetical protein
VLPVGVVSEGTCALAELSALDLVHARQELSSTQHFARTASTLSKLNQVFAPKLNQLLIPLVNFITNHIYRIPPTLSSSSYTSPDSRVSGFRFLKHAFSRYAFMGRSSRSSSSFCSSRRRRQLYLRKYKMIQEEYYVFRIRLVRIWDTVSNTLRFR